MNNDWHVNPYRPYEDGQKRWHATYDHPAGDVTCWLGTFETEHECEKVCQALNYAFHRGQKYRAEFIRNALKA